MREAQVVSPFLRQIISLIAMGIPASGGMSSPSDILLSHSLGEKCLYFILHYFYPIKEGGDYLLHRNFLVFKKVMQFMNRKLIKLQDYLLFSSD
jgi:hypothetical protein